MRRAEPGLAQCRIAFLAEAKPLECASLLAPLIAWYSQRKSESGSKLPQGASRAMCVKLRRIRRRALKARCSKAQGEGRGAAEALGWKWENRALQGRHSCMSRPYRAQNLYPSWDPGFQSPLRVLFHPGLCYVALSALQVCRLA